MNIPLHLIAKHPHGNLTRVAEQKSGQLCVFALTFSVCMHGDSVLASTFCEEFQIKGTTNLNIMHVHPHPLQLPQYSADTT